jgi:predicted lipid-binding transport protein (Tim44 family)
MKTLLTIVVLAFFTLGAMSDADARKRFGGGTSSGMQRESITKDAGKPGIPASPAAAPSVAPKAAGAAGAAAAPAASGASKWLGPLAGLAVGGLIGSMLFGGGFSGLKFFDILLMAGLAFVAYKLIRMYMSKRATPAGLGSGANGNMEYAGAGGAYNPSQPAQKEVSRPVATQYAPASAPAATAEGGRIVAPEIGSRLSGGHASPAEVEAATVNPRIPADFDVPPFQRQAHAAFIRLQAANDAKDLNDIRDFTTPEMYAEIALQMQERGDVPQKTEVVTLAVNVLEVVKENNRAIASVRYTGTIREDVGALPEPFDEVWHVVKALDNDKATWQLAGIQQLS